MTSPRGVARQVGRLLGFEVQQHLDRVQARRMAAERLDAVKPPANMPAVDTLAGHAERAGDLGLGNAGGNQLGGAPPAGFQLLTIKTVGRGHALEPATPCR
jgi:hypothetical protein